MAETLRIDATSAFAGLRGLAFAGEAGIARALKRTATTAATFLVRETAKDMGLTQTAVKKSVSTTVRAADGVARIQATGSPLALALFKARGPKPSKGKGKVTYDVGQGRKTVAHGFFAQMRSGHLGIFVRTGATGRSAGAWSMNLPIKERFGPSVAHVFAKYLPKAADIAQEALLKNAAHELQFALTRGR